MTRSFDVVVLGAGVFGLASALRIASSGKSVLVFDRSPVGTEASGFALGRVDPLLKGSGSSHGATATAPSSSLLTKTSSQSRLGRTSYELHLKYREEIQSISGIDYQFDDQPTLQLFYTAEERAEGEAGAAVWTAQGFPSEIVEAGDIKQLDSRIASTEYGGAVMRGPFFIDSLKFVQALAQCARRAGAVIEQATVTGCTTCSGSTIVHTDGGDILADNVVAALGPWTGPFMRGLGFDLPVSPSNGEILRMTPPAGGPLSVHIHGPCSLVQ
jgi:glycine/D-amino acid oxidase-like deaminating enzyme